jgi:ribosomal protein S6
LLRQLATKILDDGGVVRSFNLMAHDQELPYRMKKYEEIYSRATIYSVLFDVSPRSLPKIRQQLSYDEDILRATILKIGDSVDKISSFVPPEKL